MKIILVSCAIIYLSVSAPISDDAGAKILSYENDNDAKGNYEFSFQTSNGISRKEFGRLVNAGAPDEHIEVQGEYSYTDPEGKLVVVQYTANENGYHIVEGKQMIPMPPIGLPPAAVATLLG